MFTLRFYYFQTETYGEDCFMTTVLQREQSPVLLNIYLSEFLISLLSYDLITVGVQDVVNYLISLNGDYEYYIRGETYVSAKICELYFYPPLKLYNIHKTLVFSTVCNHFVLDLFSIIFDLVNNNI